MVCFLSIEAASSSSVSLCQSVTYNHTHFVSIIANSVKSQLGLLLLSVLYLGSLVVAGFDFCLLYPRLMASGLPHVSLEV
jgi:hypothetical protein